MATTVEQHPAQTLNGAEHGREGIPVENPATGEIVATVPAEGAVAVTMHSGKVMRFRAVPEGYDPTDRLSVMAYLERHHAKNEIVTGLLYADEEVPDVHELNHTSTTPLVAIPFGQLCPGGDALRALQENFR